jgi:hypothetical protein
MPIDRSDPMAKRRSVELRYAINAATLVTCHNDGGNLSLLRAEKQS